MVAYCTQADLVTRFGQDEILALSDLDNSGEIDAARVTQAIADASVTIDGYLSGRYTLPLSTTPEMLNLIAGDLARYRLMGTRPTDEATARNKDALAWLDKVARGIYSLGIDQAGNTPAQDKPAIKPGRPTFTDHALAGYTAPPRGDGIDFP